MNANTPAREGLPELPEAVSWEYRYRYTLPNGGKCDWRRVSQDEAQRHAEHGSGAYEARDLYTAAQMHKFREEGIAAALSQPTQGGGEVPQDAVLWALGTRVPEEVRARYGYPVHYTVADYMAGDTDENMLVMRTVLESVAGQFPASAALPHPQPVKVYACDYCGCDYTDATYCCHRRRDYMAAHGQREATPPPPSDAAQGVQAVRVDELIEVAKAAAMKIQHNKEPWFPMTDRRLKAALLVALRAHKGEGNG
jgi:hypothetical protein